MPEDVSSCGVINYGANDHDIIFVIIKTCLQRQPRQTIKIRSMKKMSSEDFIIDLSIQDWFEVLNTADASVAAEQFSEIMQRVINFHAPQREVQLKPLDSSPWLSNDVRERMCTRDLEHRELTMTCIGTCIVACETQLRMIFKMQRNHIMAIASHWLFQVGRYSMNY